MHRATDPAAAEGFERVCAVSDLGPGKVMAATLRDGARVCVGNRDGKFFAVNDRCPHQQFPLSDGELAADGTIVCSWHGAAFDCITGRAVRGPVRDRGQREAPLGRLIVHDVRVASGDVLVRPQPEAF